ncbi:hypothetical protein J2766_003418 [Agrobacterium tumefaciens]|uniref:Uncharacterized protein n=1 Tax=Agrobacterium tumefaciens TaxID=358 RepID=A0AAW8LMM2_AGRTU|nr:hypothetical protein [Agrobacterium tumefaciens]MBP2566821.1 hypothetical protein [Agrobacterium tumefaciens]MDR6700720.1 hypothetical protein [Agrobacterium tumefaciens]
MRIFSTECPPVLAILRSKRASLRSLNSRDPELLPQQVDYLLRRLRLFAKPHGGALYR